ncbi:MAG: 2-oxoacid:ferredoxin oxidoreductase subunit beta [Deltaproteobacteria bacterium]|nr:2-oxoacid:ferredoxin oxidoreductase subunit beta [Deltaproteobacteria bacterium]
MTMNAPAPAPLTRKDFLTNQDIRWCPGCGDYAILSQVQRLMPELNIPRERIVFVSGIGCSSRFPYYMNTYGFHTIHGRATAIASGLKIARPDLEVWVVTGDGDALSIGGNHLIHCLRRNIGVRILLFNNRIYGLTKGQYSPTSEQGKVTKSTPYGAPDYPLEPISLALGAQASFVARTIDVENQHMPEVLKRVAQHKGTAFVEIYQNCNVFNDGAFDYTTDREQKADRQLILKHGEPLLFGKQREKGIRLNARLEPEVVALGNGVSEQDCIRHDETNPVLAQLLARLQPPNFPTALGVIYAATRPSYEAGVAEQIAAAKAKKPIGVKDLIQSGHLWTVK